MKDLLPFLSKHINWINSRLKTLQDAISGLTQGKLPYYSSIANYIDFNIEKCSKEKRIYRLLKDQEFNPSEFGKAILALFPKKQHTLIIDRTNWKVGSRNINILTLCILIKGNGVPILFNLLDKAGACSSEEKELIIKQFIEYFPDIKIKCVLGDREFFDNDLVTFLEKSEIDFVFRLKENMQFKHRNGGKMRCDKYCDEIPEEEEAEVEWRSHFIKIQHKRSKSLYIASSKKITEAMKLYKKRWAIETCFKSLKSQGFELERSKIRTSERMHKMLMIMALTMAILTKIGQISKDKKPIKPIKSTKRGDSQRYTSFRLGINLCTEWLIQASRSTNEIFCEFWRFLKSV
jgi:transposase